VGQLSKGIETALWIICEEDVSNGGVFCRPEELNDFCLPNKRLKALQTLRNDNN